jgi:uncharacterized membrane protein
MTTDPPADDRFALDRIVFFSDAVFAIVITILVLPLTADVGLSEGAGGLASQVWALRPKLLAFAVSFLVIGQFWIAHHRIFNRVRRYDLPLMWLNLVSLLTISFLPFPTALLGAASSEDHSVVVFYAATLTVCSVMLSATLLYALWVGRLVDEDLDQRTARDMTWRSLATGAIFLVSTGVAFLGLGPAMLCWLVLLPATRILLSRRRSPQDTSSA